MGVIAEVRTFIDGGMSWRECGSARARERAAHKSLVNLESSPSRTFFSPSSMRDTAALAIDEWEFIA